MSLLLSRNGQENGPISYQGYLIDGGKDHKKRVAHLREVREHYEDKLSHGGKIVNIHHLSPQGTFWKK